MTKNIKMAKSLILAIMVILLGGAMGCQKLDRPALGDYPKDANPPGGPLKFFAAFDGTTSNPLMNAVDSIRANFPSDNPLTQIAGITGKAVQGDGVKVLKYAGSNDFISTATSFTIAMWEKRNGAPQGNASFFFTIPSSNGYWANAQMFGLFDWGTVADSAIIKVDVVDTNLGDNWFQWTDKQRVKGIQDNTWHHIAFVYDATTSTMTLYVDGVANPNKQTWGTHGSANMNPLTATGLDIGGNSKIKDLGWGQSWDGGIDQFRLYSKALSAAEVSALFTSKS
jgi:hypothetical protein